jgi:hypothetical protein
LKEKLKGLKPADIPVKCIETLREVAAAVDAKAPADAAAFRLGCVKSVNMSLRQQLKAGCWVS